MAAEKIYRTAPFYCVGDVSQSMEGEPIASLNQGLEAIHDKACTDPGLAEVIRFGLITFSGEATAEIEPALLNRDMQMPTLAHRTTGTAYGTAFDELFNRLPGDVANATRDAEGEGTKILRPIVFFLSDGKPTDSGTVWRGSLERLKDSSFVQRPNIFAFGLGNADPTVIAEVATHPEWAWMQAHGTAISDAIAGFAEEMLVTMTQTATGAGDGS